MAFLLSFLPSWFSGGLAWIVVAAGAAAAIYGMLPWVPYKIIAAPAGAVLLLIGGYLGGVAATEANSEAAALRQQLADAKATAAVQAAQLSALQSDSAAAAAQASDLSKFKDAADAVTSHAPDGVGLDAPTADGVRSLWPSH